MEATRELRVSERQISAAAGPKVVFRCGSSRILTTGPSGFDVFLWPKAESSDGKVWHDPNHNKQKPDQNASFWTRSHLNALSCAYALHNTGRSTCVNGKPRFMKDPRSLYGMPWSRSDKIGPFPNSLIEDTVWAGSMEYPWYFGDLLHSITQIWAFNISMQCSNRGFEDYQRPDPQCVVLDRGVAEWLENNTYAEAKQNGDSQIWGFLKNTNA